MLASAANSCAVDASGTTEALVPVESVVVVLGAVVSAVLVQVPSPLPLAEAPVLAVVVETVVPNALEKMLSGAGKSPRWSSANMLGEVSDLASETD